MIYSFNISCYLSDRFNQFNPWPIDYCNWYRFVVWFDFLCNDNKTPITAQYKLAVIIVIGAQPAESLSSIHSLGFFHMQMVPGQSECMTDWKRGKRPKKKKKDNGTHMMQAHSGSVWEDA